MSVKYDEVVKYRMDLCEVKRRLDDSLEMTRDVSGKMPAYTALQFVKDVRTVWHNCIIFNAEGSAIARMAKHLSKVSAYPHFKYIPLIHSCVPLDV